MTSRPACLVCCCSTTGGAVENSWETWWRDENSYAKNLSTSAKIFMVLKTAPYLMVALGLIYRPLFIDFKFDELTYSLIKIGQALILLAIYLVIDAIAPWLRRRHHDARVYMRIFKMLLLAGMACIVIFVLVQHPGYFKYMLALGYFGATVSTVLLVLGFPQVSLFHFLHDIIVAHVIFIPLFLFSALQVRPLGHTTTACPRLPALRPMVCGGSQTTLSPCSFLAAGA